MQKNKKMKVLLIDDEEPFARALAERLSSRGVTAKTVFGGREAIAAIHRDEPDVMILDLRMPGLDGMEVLRRVKKDHPDMQTIILSGHGTDSDKKEAARLGVVDFFTKPADINNLTERIRAAFASKKRRDPFYFYGSFLAVLQKHLDNEGISLGENGLGIKCFCRDDNQDQLGYLLMGNGGGAGWFDLNSFGAYPAGRSLESFAPPSHHIPELQKNPWTVVFHATHVGCDSQYTLGITDRYGMRRPSSSCGLIEAILKRHHERRKGKKPSAFRDFEMAEAEKALMPYLDEIITTPYPMAAAAEKLFELGAEIFDALLKENGGNHFYIGGINVDFDAEHPENNLFVPKSVCVYVDAQKREVGLQ